MDVLDAITARRSVRRYQETPVPRELLEELLTAACWAPSADNAQPWYFVVLTGLEDIRRMQQTMENVVQLNVPLVAEVKTGKSWYETK